MNVLFSHPPHVARGARIGLKRARFFAGFSRLFSWCMPAFDGGGAGIASKLQFGTKKSAARLVWPLRC